MINIGQIFGSFLTTVKHGTQKTRHLQVKIGAGKDVRTIQYVRHAGFDINPRDNCIAVTIESGPSKSFRFVVGTDDFIESTLEQGEVEIYSQSPSNTKLARVQCRKNSLTYIGNTLPQGGSLQSALVKLVQGIQGATYIPYPGGSPASPVPITDATGKIALALQMIQNILDSGVS